MVSQDKVLTALRAVQDPDLHRDVVSLGFIKNLKIEGGSVDFDLELTTPACPVKDDLRDRCIQVVKAVPGVEKVEVRLSAQVRARRELEKGQALSGVKNVLAIASGKGGVGKSTVTVNLACALAKQGARVGLLDADIYGPSQSMMLGVDEDPEMDSQKRVYPPVARGIKVISMAMFADEAVVWRGPMASQMVQNFVRQVEWGELDYLLIDMPPGTGDIQLTLTQTAPITGAVIVTTPQDVALLDAKKGLRMFEKVSVPVLGVIENMSFFICDQCGKQHDIFKSDGGKRISRSTGVPFLGQIPIEPRIAKGGDSGEPIVHMAADSASAQAFTAIAGRLAAELSVLNSRDSAALIDFKLEWNKMPVEAL